MTEGDVERTRTRITDPQVMRALAHPARIEIIEYLASTGAGVTATQAVRSRPPGDPVPDGRPLVGDSVRS